MCHGYLSQRAEVLTLVSALQDHQFNVFRFRFHGAWDGAGSHDAGLSRDAELEAAIQALSTRDDVDPKRFGLWGVNLGGFVALKLPPPIRESQRSLWTIRGTTRAT